MQEEQGIVDERNERISELCTTRQEEAIEKINGMIKVYFRNVQYEIGKIFTEIDNLNNEVLKVQSIPNAIISKLHELFQNEIKRENEEMNYQIFIQEEEDMQKMITYD